MNRGTWNMIMGPRNMNRCPCNMIMRTCYVVMGPWNVNRGPWYVIMRPRNVNRGPCNVIMGS